MEPIHHHHRHRHVGVRPHCGICSYPMQVNDRCLLLLGNTHSTRFSRVLGPCIFPDYDSQAPDGTGLRRCRKPGCCTFQTPEASTVHCDCFQFILKHCDAKSSLDHMWIATAWQTPWREAPHFLLQESNIRPNWSLFEDFGLPHMSKLPLEIVEMIYNLSSASAFWRFHSAHLFGQQFSTPSSDNLLSIPLSTVLTWERGSKPTTTNIPHELPRLLLTIDARGLQEIKRLPGDLQLRRWRADDRVFVLTDQWKLAGVTAQFKFGLLRLTLPMTMYYGLDTWDTPTPPYLRQCQLHPSSIRPSTHFKTIDLRQITGITFFYSSNIIFAIHAHTEKAPCAQEALQRLHPSRRALATWVYIPIPQNDSVLALATPLALDKTLGTFNGCWLFRMRLAGDVLVGLTYSTRAARMVLSRSPPTTIVYSAVELEPTFVYGAYSMEMENEYLISAFKTPAITEPPFRNAFFSSASLENVDRVKIFSDESTGICRGILLCYQNGAQRALGQCRLGIDMVQNCTRPMHMCYSRQFWFQAGNPNSLQVNFVNFLDTQEHEHREPGWMHFGMKGELEFWFTAEETRLTVHRERN